MTDENFEKVLSEIKIKVREYEGEKRFSHTLCVIKEAEYICSKLSFDRSDRESVVIAAALHDITKKFTLEEHGKIASEYGFELDDLEPTVHEKTGAYFAREIFGSDIVNDKVFSAISSHTTGSASMSLTDMALFIADFTEESRKYENCIKIREYLHRECEKINGDHAKAEEVLKDVTLKIIYSTVEHLLCEHEKINLRTIAAWNSMLN